MVRERTGLAGVGTSVDDELWKSVVRVMVGCRGFVLLLLLLVVVCTKNLRSLHSFAYCYSTHFHRSYPSSVNLPESSSLNR